MFLRFIPRKKDGKEHRDYSVVKNVRLPGRRSPCQKTLLYLGELSDAQEAAWTKAIGVFDDATGPLKSLSLFPDDRAIPADLAGTSVSLHLSGYWLCRPRQYGACWRRANSGASWNWTRVGAGICPPAAKALTG